MAVVDELVTLIGYKLDERGAATLKAAKSEIVDMSDYERVKPEEIFGRVFGGV